MTQTLIWVVLFVGGMAALPWLVKRLQQRRGVLGGMSGVTPRVLSGVSVGPQQRVVVVEVGDGASKAVLVLGVTAQHVSCLHVLPPASSSAVASASTPFAQTLADVKSNSSDGVAHG